MEAKKKPEKIELEQLKKKLSTGTVTKETYKRLLELSPKKRMAFSLEKELQFLKNMRKREKERVS